MPKALTIEDVREKKEEMSPVKELTQVDLVLVNQLPVSSRSGVISTV